LLAAQVLANPILGWLGDRWSYHLAMMIGAVAAILGGLLAWWAPTAGWFYLVFVLTGIANAAIWTVAIAMIMEFGTEAERPAYIGLGNSLVAPLTILAPLFGGWLAEVFSYPAAFLGSAVAGGGMLAMLLLLVKDPRKAQEMRAPLPWIDSEEPMDL
jgi:MFS family permease